MVKKEYNPHEIGKDDWGAKANEDAKHLFDSVNDLADQLAKVTTPPKPSAAEVSYTNSGMSGVSHVKGALDLTHTSLAGAKKDLDAAEAKIATLEGRTSTLEGKTTTLETTINTANGKIKTYKEATVTLSAAGWAGAAAPFTQSVGVSGIPANAGGDYDVQLGAGYDQAKAFAEAAVWITAQPAGSVTFAAAGKKPSLNIPVTIGWWS